MDHFIRSHRSEGTCYDSFGGVRKDGRGRKATHLIGMGVIASARLAGRSRAMAVANVLTGFRPNCRSQLITKATCRRARSAKRANVLTEEPQQALLFSFLGQAGDFPGHFANHARDG